MRDIVAELHARDGLEFREWSRALPQQPDRPAGDRPAAPRAGTSPRPTLFSTGSSDRMGRPEDGRPRSPPARGAGRGAACCGRNRKEAAEQYRQAIELVDNDLVRRSWWFNLADIAQRLNDEAQQQAAIRAALAVHSSDEITRTRQPRSRRRATPKAARRSYGSAKAN